MNQFHENNHSKTLGCMKIKSVFRAVKWCFNASWGLKGLNININALRVKPTNSPPLPPPKKKPTTFTQCQCKYWPIIVPGNWRTCSVSDNLVYIWLFGPPVHIWTKLGWENLPRMVTLRWMRWHYPPDIVYRTRNSGPGDLMPSTLPLGHEGSPQ